MTMTVPPAPDSDSARPASVGPVEPGAPSHPVLPEPRRSTRRPRWRAAREFGYSLATLPLAILGFVYVVFSLSAGPPLSVTFLGLPMLAGLLVGARGLGAAQRGLVAGVLGERVDGPPPFRPRHPGAWQWIRSGLGDGAGWRTFLYLLLKFPLAIGMTVAAVTGWIGGLGYLTYPVWRRWLPVEHDDRGRPHRGASFTDNYFLDTWPRLLLAVGAGVVLVVVGLFLVRALVALDRLLVRGLLGPTRRSLEKARMRELELTRAAVVDDSAAALRRIERDLHDGAQARLVAMAMNLGTVREQLATGGEDVDLAETRSRVDAAHRDVKAALVELRDLARGIHPPILDAGLDAALTSLAARGPQSVQVRVDLPDRPSAAIETIAYFCAAELLTNAAKHSRADEVWVTVTGRAGRMRMTVADDGRGGAALDRAARGGLAGLVERVRAVDGSLDLTSPPGGPTRATIDLPLHA
ncbi:sensor histidine kinase [Frankia sp. AgB32]|uniref:sensor histidine kinase n=1 Tax=Frankia sp. AgB32 TaxID=631119 RepID=UPI00200C3E5E|nr:sensor histidine kinase [Frankia sp. AgB32]